MTKQNREVWITGIGLVSCFGEGATYHWDILGGDSAPEAIQEKELFAPYTVHPLPEIDWSKQIPRRGDQRQMENWQRLGTYAAGLALDDAGLKDNEELVSSMDLVVAAGGGERDIDSDHQIMAEAKHHSDRDRLLIERLPNDLRPTLFLAQLSNLLAGNISIVHKVTGSSRTYMGEENAGVTVIENVVARIAAGQSTHALVGGAYNAERLDLLLIQELGNYLSRNCDDPVIKRLENGGGIIPGSSGAFLVLEDAEFAKARGATPYAKISGVSSDMGARDDKTIAARVKTIFDNLPQSKNTIDSIISGASGVKNITEQEFAFLDQQFGSDIPVRATNSLIGNSMEGTFPANIALAALALKNGKFFPPSEESEKPATLDPKTILVTSFGHRFGEGLALVEKV
ncbi:MAG: beta-ketoacyl-ACP synthase [Hyphomicrobiales bacterium]|nr:beta-ketoacyl-ACP synthase [Hyphomicrobiales bacterium]